MYADIIIIGGGASGLFAAINAKKENNSVLILEHGIKPGKKILSTGNGRCNLTNTFCTVSKFDVNPEGIFPYRSSGDISFAERVIESFDASDTELFFESLGILTEDKNGYVYPRSEQASTISDALIKACEWLGVEIATEIHVDSVKKIPDEGFMINGEYTCKKLLIASGGMSAKSTGSDGSMYGIVRDLGHSVIDPMPALCAIRCSDKFFRELQGVRSDSAVYLKDKCGNTIISTKGNLQFTSYGISGIPVFQISSCAGDMFRSHETLNISIDLLPEMKEDVLAAFIDDYCTVWGTSSLPSILNGKIIKVLEKILVKKKSGNSSFGNEAARLIKDFRVTPTGLNDFDSSQITKGGVSTLEINPETMESSIVPGLFFAGEIIDVDGICGGYNLQWAWSTAYIAAEGLLRS